MNVILLMAQTVDGKVAHAREELINWTCREDKKFFVAETKRAGVIIMGRTTFATFGRPLPCRTIIVLTRSHRESIIDEEKQGRVEFTSDEPEVILQKINEKGFSEVIIAGGPTINTLFLSNNLIDEIKISIEPKIFGTGLSLFEGQPFDKNLELINTANLTANVIVLHYKVIKT